MASTTDVRTDVNRRITKRTIQDRVDRLVKAGADIKIDSAYGQYRLVDSRESNLSLRGTPRLLDVWLDGYETARGQIENRIWMRAMDRSRKVRYGDVGPEAGRERQS